MRLLPRLVVAAACCARQMSMQQYLGMTRNVEVNEKGEVFGFIMTDEQKKEFTERMNKKCNVIFAQGIEQVKGMPQPRPDPFKQAPAMASDEKVSTEELKAKQEVEEYYKTVPFSVESKQDAWKRVKAAKNVPRPPPDDAMKHLEEEIPLEAQRPPDHYSTEPHEVDLMWIETDVKEKDPFHWKLGELAFIDEQQRLDFYTLHAIAQELNNTKWKSIEAKLSKKREVGFGTGIRSMYYRDACMHIINTRQMPTGDLVDTHPKLRPFADVIKRHKFTKTFLRGFVDARLKVMPQPASLKELAAYYEKYYSYFFYTQLEMLGIRHEDAVEHCFHHLGIAYGITLHTVMLWRKYARCNATMFPADLCADHIVNMSLLRQLSMSTYDRGVLMMVRDCMMLVRKEMESVRQLVKNVPVKAWPLLMEAFLPNYYVQFLQRHKFNVTRYFSENFVMGIGFNWYASKKLWEWKRTHKLELLVAEAAPLRFLPKRWSKYNGAVMMGTQHSKEEEEEEEEEEHRCGYRSAQLGSTEDDD